MEITNRHGCSPVSLLRSFRTPFPKNASGGLILSNEKYALVYDDKTKSYISRHVHLHEKVYLMISEPKRYVIFATFSADQKFVIYYKLKATNNYLKKTITSMKSLFWQL